MRNLVRVLLAVFTASLSQTSDLEQLSPRNMPLACRAILCLRYLTHFILIAKYNVHTPGSVQSMRDYLAEFYKYNDVFLPFRASKTVKSILKEAS